MDAAHRPGEALPESTSSHTHTQGDGVLCTGASSQQLAEEEEEEKENDTEEEDSLTDTEDT